MGFLKERDHGAGGDPSREKGLAGAFPVHEA